jgi:NAD(P)-dependent dehydrogenase (short-subunit alcohol dehydrogenase family)
MSDYVNDHFGLDDRTAVVIGATGELGGAIAEGLCRAGANTVVVGRNEDEGRRRAEALRDESEAGTAVFHACDTTDRADLQGLVEFADEEFGQIDVWVNSAGVNAATPFFEIDEEEWDHIMEVNLKGVFLACQVAGRYLIDQGEGGSIINISSMSGITPLSRVFTYSASKAGLINLSQNLAREWAPHDIRVNCIAPGFFPAEQNRKILTDERIADIMGHTPMDRFGEADELVGTTLLLASEEAGSFITGANIPVDGGYSSMTI